MKEGDPLQSLLRSALPPTTGEECASDLWTLVEKRLQSPIAWSWLDIGLAAAVAIVPLVFPSQALLLTHYL